MNQQTKVVLVAPGGDHSDPLAQQYKGYLYRTMDGANAVLWDAREERWVELDEGVQPPYSFAFPTDMAEPLLDALSQALGVSLTEDSATLSEALSVEQARVDKVLDHFMGKSCRACAS